MSFDRLGFRADGDRRTHLEHIARTFAGGYHAALQSSSLEALEAELAGVDINHRGFAFEGAAMGVFLLDLLAPWPRRDFSRFLEGPGRAHPYMIHVGAGWAIARLHWPLGHALRRLDPLLRWLAVDGYGFHEGFFRRRRYLERTDRAPLPNYPGRAFDQGFGRSLWFVEGCDVERIRDTISRFAEPRRPDLWAGVGLACAYAGGVSGDTIRAIAAAAEKYRGYLRQGAAFAATARDRADNRAIHTEEACAILCGMPASAVAAITNEAMPSLAERPSELAYENWRAAVRERLANRTGSASS